MKSGRRPYEDPCAVLSRRRRMLFAVLLCLTSAGTSANPWTNLAADAALNVPGGTRVLFTLQSTRPDGSNWDTASPGNPLDALPDPTICLQLGRVEMCMPKLAGIPVIPEARTMWYVNTLAGSFELPERIAWTERFRATATDTERPPEGALAALRNGGRDPMGRADCTFGQPCVLVDLKTGGVVGELLALPTSRATGAWQSYLSSCVDPDSILVREWYDADRAMFREFSKPPVTLLGYRHLVALQERIDVEPKIELVLQTAVALFPNFEDPRVRARHVWDISKQLADARDDPSLAGDAKQRIANVLVALNRHELRNDIATAAFGCE